MQKITEHSSGDSARLQLSSRTRLSTPPRDLSKKPHLAGPYHLLNLHHRPHGLQPLCKHFALCILPPITSSTNKLDKKTDSLTKKTDLRDAAKYRRDRESAPCSLERASACASQGSSGSSACRSTARTARVGHSTPYEGHITAQYAHT